MFSVRMAEVVSIRNKWARIRQGRSSVEVLCWDFPAAEQMKGISWLNFTAKRAFCVVSLPDKGEVLGPFDRASLSWGKEGH